MPFYEYRCEACGHELEALQKISAAPLLECPACKEKKLVKLVSAAAFRLKGGGWYETDFKSGSKKNIHDTGNSGNSGNSSDGGNSGKQAPEKKAKPSGGCSGGGCACG